ncbi:MAG: carboxymuconolactone decarboxylase family protein [Beijerinckiaceae bacterium]|nr:carboxymuconolactone decarboxylase family protein [Beijerinckiaceae bacterium]
MTPRLNYLSIIPDAMKAIGGVYQYVSSSGLPKDLIELVYLRVSLINGCAYCIDAHTRELRNANVPAEKIALIPVWSDAGDWFSQREQAALLWAETVTLVSETGIPDEDYEIVSEHFDERERADLTVAISLMNVYNRIAIGFRRLPQSKPAS